MNPFWKKLWFRLICVFVVGLFEVELLLTGIGYSNSFSIDIMGPSFLPAPFGQGLTGDGYTVFIPIPGQAPTPIITGGQLGLGSSQGCQLWGTIGCEGLSGISFGFDALPTNPNQALPTIAGLARPVFSLGNRLNVGQVHFGDRRDEIASPVLIPIPDPYTESLSGEAASDLFEALFTGIKPGPILFAQQYLDGNGQVDSVFGLPASSGLGLIEGTPVLLGDDVRSYDSSPLPPLPQLIGTPVFFTLEPTSTYFSNIVNPGGGLVGAEDIFVVLIGMGAPQVFVHGETYGLTHHIPGIPTLFNLFPLPIQQGDFIDALAVAFPPGQQPVPNTLPSATNATIVFSLERTSNAIGSPAISSAGVISVTEGDLLIGQVGGKVVAQPPFQGSGAFPLILVLAEELGLQANRFNRGTLPLPREDNINALTDGGFTVFTLGPTSRTLSLIGAGPEDLLEVVFPGPFPGPPQVQVALRGTQFGLTPGDVIDAFSFGVDIVSVSNLHFSIDRNSSGFPPYFGTPFVPDVQIEAAAYEASSDIFAHVSQRMPPPLSFPSPTDYSIGASFQVWDGDGVLNPLFQNIYTLPFPSLGLGLTEGWVTGPGVWADDITSLGNHRVPALFVPGVDPLYFSLTPGSPTLSAINAQPADILVSTIGGTPTVAISASGLGLDGNGAGTDDVDGLVLNFNQATGAFRAAFSLAPGSATRGWGIGNATTISPADVLIVDSAGAFIPGTISGFTSSLGVNVQILATAENLGLQSARFLPSDELDAVSFPNTSAGSNVTVNPAPNVSVTFSQVTNSGTTTVTTTQTNPQPTGFQIGNLLPFYDINTTATYTGQVRVGIVYNPAGLTPPQERALRFFQLQGTTWVDITDTTITPNPDTVNNVIVGVTNQLSFFSIGYPDSDMDSVPDSQDLCPGTPGFAVDAGVIGDDGCVSCDLLSEYVDEQVPQSGEYRNHGDYASRAGKIVSLYLDAGLISEECASRIMNPIARSNIGKPARK